MQQLYGNHPSTNKRKKRERDSISLPSMYGCGGVGADDARLSTGSEASEDLRHSKVARSSVSISLMSDDCCDAEGFDVPTDHEQEGVEAPDDGSNACDALHDKRGVDHLDDEDDEIDHGDDVDDANNAHAIPYYYTVAAGRTYYVLGDRQYYTLEELLRLDAKALNAVRILRRLGPKSMKGASLVHRILKDQREQLPLCWAIERCSGLRFLCPATLQGT